jgi:hypothetical protein
VCQKKETKELTGPALLEMDGYATDRHDHSDARFDPPRKQNAERFVSLAGLFLAGLYIRHRFGVSSYHPGLRKDPHG